MGDDKRRPYANNSATRPGRGDPRGRPSRIQHGFLYFVRGGVVLPNVAPDQSRLSSLAPSGLSGLSGSDAQLIGLASMYSTTRASSASSRTMWSKYPRCHRPTGIAGQRPQSAPSRYARAVIDLNAPTIRPSAGGLDIRQVATRPCKWFGMTTNGSTSMPAYRSARYRHCQMTISPAALGRTSSSTTSPNTHRRSRTTMVTK